MLVVTGVCGLLAGWAVGAVRITGRVATQSSTGHVHVRVWALGHALLKSPALASTPLAERDVPPASGFAVDVPDAALPLDVEVEAPGHLGATFRIDLPEQLALPAVWLPAGVPARVAVERPGRATPEARLRGEITAFEPAVPIVGRWRPTIPARQTDGQGRVAICVPGSGTLRLAATTPDGAWGVTRCELPVTGDIKLAVDTRAIPVTVRGPGGEPVTGVVVADGAAPPGCAIISDPAGRASVQVGGADGAVLVALGAGHSGTVRVAAGSGPVTVVVTPWREVKLQSASAAKPWIADPDWIPPALRGGAAFVSAEEQAHLPFLGSGGGLTVWRPDTSPEVLSIRDTGEPHVFRLGPAARVKGAVVDGTDAPLGGVPVWCTFPRRGQGRWNGLPPAAALSRWLTLPWAVSDPAGAFTITGLPVGAMRLGAERPGAPRATSAVVRNRPGGQENVTLRVLAGTVLAVTVHDREGRPLSGATVEVRPDAVRAAEGGAVIMVGGRSRASRPVASTATDHEGRARLTGLATGPVIVEVQCPGFVGRRVDLRLTPEGKDLGVLALDPAAVLSGRVVDGEDRGVAGARVAITTEAGDPVVTARDVASDSTGSFVVADMPAHGTFVLSAAAAEHLPSGTTRVTMPSESPVRVRVRRAQTLEGRVLDEQTRSPVAGAKVSARKPFDPASSRSTRRPTDLREPATCQTDEEGTFRLPGLSPGESRIKVVAEGYRHVEERTLIPEEGAPKPVTISVSRGVSLRGRVVDRSQAPVGGIEVSAVVTGVDALAPEDTLRTRSGADGGFELEGMEARRYEVTAQDPDLGKATEIVDPRQVRDVVLRLEGPGALQGRVLSTEGVAIPDAHVTATWNEVRDEARTDASGSFAMESCESGRRWVTASAEGFCEEIREVRVTSGRATTVEMRLAPGGVVTGRVVGLRPDALRDCVVESGRTVGRPDPDGRFSLQGIPMGRGQVTAITTSTRRRRAVGFELTDSRVPVEVEISFGGTVTVRGRVVRAGRPAAGLTVSAELLDGQGNGTDVCDDSGGFSITGLLPGRARVAALDGGQTLVAREIELDGDEQVDLEVPGASLTGHVVATADGTPIGGATVVARSLAPPAAGRSTLADEQGFFHLDELAPGSCVVRAEAANHTPGEVRLVLEAGRPAETTVTLDPARRQALVVTTAGGGPATEVLVVMLRDGHVGWPEVIDCDRAGRAELPGLAPGTYTLWVATATGGAAVVTTSVPGPDTPVRLRPAAPLALVAGAGAAAGVEVRLLTGDGLVVPVSPWSNPGQSEWLAVGQAGQTIVLPVDRYTVQIRQGGSPREATVTLTASGASLDLAPA